MISLLPVGFCFAFCCYNQSGCELSAKLCVLGMVNKINVKLPLGNNELIFQNY